MTPKPDRDTQPGIRSHTSLGSRVAIAHPGSRGTGLSRPVAADWSSGRTRRRCLHCADRAHGDAICIQSAVLPGGALQCLWRFPRHGLPALSLFSGRSGQWRTADQGGSLRARWKHLAAHCLRQVRLYRSHSGERNSARSRGTVGTSGRRDRLRPRPLARFASGKGKALIPVGAAAAIAAAFNTPMAAVLFALEEVVGDFHAPVLGSVVLASATSWAVLTSAPRQQSVVSRAAVRTGSPSGVRYLCGVRRRWRLSFSSVHQALAGDAQALPATAEKHSLVAPGSWWRHGWPDGLVCAAGSGRGIQLCRVSS